MPSLTKLSCVPIYEPLTKPPPCIITNTGSFSSLLFAGVVTLRYRQSSLMGMSPPLWFGSVCCGGRLPHESDLYTPSHGFLGTGAFQRRFPTGASAYGIFLYRAAPSCSTPSISPCVTVVRSIKASALEPITIAATTANKNFFIGFQVLVNYVIC